MNEERITQAIATFRKAYPDFHSFKNPGPTFAEEELNYKREVSEAFQALGKKLLGGDYDSNPGGFVDDFKGLLEMNLKSTNKRQNLVNWRDIDNLIKLDDSNDMSLEELIHHIRHLLEAEDANAVSAAIDSFSKWLSDKGLTPGQTKIWPSFVLYMWRPDSNIFIKPRPFDKILELCGFDKLGFGQKLNGERYRRVMQDMTSLRNRLDEDKFEVKDYIDVQSFLWVSFNKKETQNIKKPEDSESLSIVKNEEDIPESTPAKQAKNVILYGPPGTGKTYTLRNDYFPQYTSENETGDNQKRYEFITFHQSYSYEEFVEGIRPELFKDEKSAGNVSYVLNKGVFRRICERAQQDRSNRYAIFIDEINRGNISRIFGELITLMELDKRDGASNTMQAVLPYSGETFSVPGNLDIYGTMNTADRSLAHIDTALRRRFTFKELMPDAGLLDNVIMDQKEIDLKLLLRVMNERIEALFDREHTIGHAYFLGDEGKTLDGNELPAVFQDRIIPLLTEYFFDDWSKVRAVLADDRCTNNPEWQFISEREVPEKVVLPSAGSRNKKVFQINKAAFNSPGTYIKIYSPPDQDND